jgi:hypothetical protein
MQDADRQITAIKAVLDCEHCLALLKGLHKRRYQAAKETVVLSFEDLLNVLAVADVASEEDDTEVRRRLVNRWLPQLDVAGMIHYDDSNGAVAVTPLTTLHWLAIQPGVDAHDREQLEAALAWLAWRDPDIAEQSDPYEDR